MSGAAVMPRLALVADRFTEPRRAARVVALVEAGVRWVHLRDHAAGEAAFRRAAAGLVEALRRVAPDVQIAVNTRLAVAEALDVDLHVGGRGPAVAAARARLGAGRRLGYSAHGLEDAVKARQAGADYVFLSPIFPTPSKPGHPGQGLARLVAVCADPAARPVLALGGITPDRVGPCLRAGAHGVAVLSGLMDAADPRAAVRAYLASIHAHSSEFP